MPTWDIKKHMPDQTGKVNPCHVFSNVFNLVQVAIVTGGNTGIGKEIVRHLALNNAKVYMASRTESRALAAIKELESEHPELAQKPGIAFLQLDLSSLESSQTAAQTFLEKEERLDILSGSCYFYTHSRLLTFVSSTVNNAGIMATPYELTEVCNNSPATAYELISPIGRAGTPISV